MAERDRFNQRNDERGGAGGRRPERAGAWSGDPDAQRGGGRSEYGGYGGAGDTGRGGWGAGRGEGQAAGGSRGHGGTQGGYGGTQGYRGAQGYRGEQGGYGGERSGYGGGHGDYGGRGERDDERSWSAAQSLGTGSMPYGSGGGEAGFGSEDPSRRWSEAGWSRRERWESGGGTGWSGPSGLGGRTDAGYGAGGTAYGGSGGGALGDWRSRQGTMGGGTSGAGRNRGPKGWQRSDERIHDDVCERLAGEPGVDPSDVSVEVRGGNVVLTGSVPDRGMKYRIEDIVDGCSGVTDVDNRLRVSRGGMAGALGGAAGGRGTTTDARVGDDRGGSRGSLLGRLFGFTTGARLSDIMTRNPRTVGPDETLTKVAQAMREQDVGAIPVCTGRKLTGMITDRDIVVRAAAGGKPLDSTKVSEAMTTQVHACYEDEDVESALDKMGDLQIRRIPVIDRANQLVGIVSLGDFAQRETGDVEDALQDISKPA
jgi:CBS domain-containing protein